ncbi:MAG: EAL domain-containing protein, partial [Candidatus Accumulibacter sp.]|nr:EAL domain-containing protein [Accumulibacter sp.]
FVVALTSALVGWSFFLILDVDPELRFAVKIFGWVTATIASALLAYLPIAGFFVMAMVTVPPITEFLRVITPETLSHAALTVAFSLVYLKFLLQYYWTIIEAVESRLALEREHRKTAEAKDEISRLALSDPLTGLPNRRRFQDQVDGLIRGYEDTGVPFCIGVVDLDGFKPINDVFGHSVGDDVLVEVGARLAAVLGGRGMVARLGGDEFGIIVPMLQSRSEAEQLGADLARSLQKPFDCGVSSAMLSGSCGFAFFPQAGQRAEVLVDRADIALYEAKKAGRGRTTIFTIEMEDAIRHQALIEQALRRAISDEVLELAYHPIVRLADRRPVAFEALARWNDPELGVIPPDVFIPVAEKSGLIGELTVQLFRRAVREAASWPKNISLSFNLSVVQLVQPSCGLAILSILGEAGLRPGRLILEITETALLSDFEKARKTISDLKRSGVHIALDDFGTGYASFGYLDKISIDKIKIDRSFTAVFGHKNGDEAIVQAIVDLARANGLKTTAEGVETESQYEYLKSIGCDELQGFLLAAPLTHDEFQNLWKERDRDAIQPPGTRAAG